MKKIALLISLVSLVMLFGCSAKYVIVHPKIPVNYFRRMAILPFNEGQGINSTGLILADGLQTKLVENVPQLELVERHRINDVIKEINFMRSGYVDTRTAVTIGKLVGARLIMTGQIKDLSITRAREVMYGSIRVSVRVIDVERGIIKWAKEVKIRHPGPFGRYKAFHHYTGRDEFKSDMIEIVCDLISKEFYPHKERV